MGRKGGILAIGITAMAVLAFCSEGSTNFDRVLGPVLGTQAALEGFEWRDGPPMLVSTADSAVVVLGDGNILVIGGITASGPTAATEIFDVKAGAWKLGPSMTVKRVGHTATLLKDGTVLVTGGDTGSGATASAELISASVTASNPLPNMFFARSGHAAILLGNGKVLVTGGTDWTKGIWKESELYDPQSHSWSPAGSMSVPRLFFSIVLMNNGTPLAVGGDSNRSSETYNSTTNSWSHVSRMVSLRSYSAVATVAGKVLAAGGIVSNSAINTTELYDPTTNSWKAAGSMAAARARFALTPLPDGELMAAGSLGPSGTTNSTEVFDPATLSWRGNLPMNVSRGAQGHAVTKDGSVYEIGGRSGASITGTVEIFSKAKVTPEKKHLQPKDLIPLVRAATELPGGSANGLIAKLDAAQAHYDKRENATCINVMNAFYNQVRAFARNGHMGAEHASAIYVAYASVVTDLGGQPLPDFTKLSLMMLVNLFVFRGM